MWRYYAYHATTSYGFYVPVGVLFLHRQGYGFGLIGLAQSAFLLTSVVADVPAGYLADRAGRRASLALGNGLVAVVMALYTLVPSGEAYVALYGLWGVAWACHSAIGDAWLYELLAARFDESTFAHAKGRAETVELAVSAGAAVLGGLLFAVAPPLPFFANAALAAAGLPLLVALPATERTDDDAVVSLRATLGALRTQLRRPEVRWLVAYAALFNVLFSLTRWLEQPSLDAVGIPVAGFGLLYAGFKLLSAGAMTTTGWLQETLGPRRFFRLMLPLSAVAYLSVAVVPLAVLPVIVLRRLLDRLSGPIRNQYLNDRLDGVPRATVLSGASMALSLASGLSNAVVGRLVEVTGPVGFLPWAGGAVTLAAGVLWLATDPVRAAEGGSGAGAGTPATAD